MSALHLEIVTPDRLVLSVDTEYVGATGVEGEFGVLPGHVPFLSALDIGVLHYHVEGKIKYVFVSGGFAEVNNNAMTVLAESAEEAESIDFARAEEARRRAEARLAKKSDDLNHIRAEAALHRATQRLSLRSHVGI